MSPEILVCASRGRRRRLRPGRRSRRWRRCPSASIIAALSSPAAGVDHRLGDLDRAGRQARTALAAMASRRGQRRRPPPRPQSRRPSARSAVMRRPNSAISLTTASGSSRASRCVPDQPGTMPTPPRAARAWPSAPSPACRRPRQVPARRQRHGRAARRWSACASRASRSKIRCPPRTQCAGKLGGRQVAPGVDVGARAEGRSPPPP